MGKAGETVVVFETPDGEQTSDLAGLSAAVKLLDWLQANAFAPSKKLLLDAYEDRFFACGMLGGELNARTTVRMSKFLDQMIGQHFAMGAPLAEFEGEKFRMQSAFLDGAAKYRRWESKQAALEWAFQECSSPPVSRYLFGL